MATKKKAAAAPDTSRKGQVDALLLAIPGVVGKKMASLDAYFVNDRMFACMNGNGIGIRLPVAVARDLQFSRADVEPFQPGGTASSREWVQINRENVADYANDLDLFKASIDFVKGGR